MLTVFVLVLAWVPCVFVIYRRSPVRAQGYLIRCTWVNANRTNACPSYCQHAFIMHVPTCTGARREICAWGFRNPFRCGFDRETDELYCGDVGQDAVEEVDIVE